MKNFLLINILFLTFSLQLSAQIPNSGFENWNVDSLQNENPDFWSANNFWYNTPTIIKTTDSHSGNYAAELIVPDISFPVIPFNLCGFNPVYAMLFNPKIPSKAKTFSAYVKCDSLTTLYSEVFIGIYGKKENNSSFLIGSWTTKMIVPNYTLIEIPLDQSKEYDSIGIEFLVFAHVNSSTGKPMGYASLKIDDMKFDGLEQNLTVIDSINIYPNPVLEDLTISVNLLNLPFKFVIYDEMGKLIEKGFSDTELTHVNTKNWKQGIYILKLYDCEKNNFINEYKIVKLK